MSRLRTCSFCTNVDFRSLPWWIFRLFYRYVDFFSRNALLFSPQVYFYIDNRLHRGSMRHKHRIYYFVLVSSVIVVYCYRFYNMINPPQASTLLTPSSGVYPPHPLPQAGGSALQISRPQLPFWPRVVAPGHSFRSPQQITRTHAAVR